MNDLDGFTLKQRKPRPVRPAPPLETNSDEAAAEDGFFPDPEEETSEYIEYGDEMFPETASYDEPLDHQGQYQDQHQDYFVPAEHGYDLDDFVSDDYDEYDGIQDPYDAQQNSFDSHYQDEGDSWERMYNFQPYFEDVEDEEFLGRSGGPVDTFF
jgi:hypothetical protein